jgi:hypothetical protein
MGRGAFVVDASTFGSTCAKSRVFTRRKRFVKSVFTSVI